MRGSDIGILAAADAVKIFALVLAVLALSSAIGFYAGYRYHGNHGPNKEQLDSSYKDGFDKGSKAGILLFVNKYFREANGQAPFKNYEEFEKYVDQNEKRQAEFNARMEEIEKAAKKKEEFNSIWGSK